MGDIHSVAMYISICFNLVYPGTLVTLSTGVIFVEKAFLDELGAFPFRLVGISILVAIPFAELPGPSPINSVPPMLSLVPLFPPLPRSGHIQFVPSK